MDIEEAKKIAAMQVQKIAEELVSVQPMDNVNLSLVAQHPLWSSFVNRHFKKDLDNNGPLA